ncbi:hypothetical protein SLEP1_g25314 [Rubroshorea leprosula]|uniref:Uncharacterized protein n=1 Tax=Rubroshorea leprosula TaxID=152421 RepID=A0AAV5JPQ7_9ROSI|nr:hypothetical protein SLEP1_g25314 [Rubroshorea leprosula]
MIMSSSIFPISSLVPHLNRHGKHYSSIVLCPPIPPKPPPLPTTSRKTGR